MREASSDISPQTRRREGRDLEELMEEYHNPEKPEYPKFVGVSHGGRKQTLISLRYAPPSIHGVGEEDFARYIEAPEGSPEFLDQMQRLMSHVYVGTLEMKSSGDPHGHRRGRLSHNNYSSRSDFSRPTPLLVVGEDMLNPGPTTGISAVTNVFTGQYHDRLNAGHVALQTSTDGSTYGLANVSGLRFLHDPETFDLLYPTPDGVPYGPVRYLTMPGFEYFVEILSPYVKRIASKVSSVRNDIPDLAARAGVIIPQPQIVSLRLDVLGGSSRLGNHVTIGDS